MKKIMACTLIASAVSLGFSSQASAGQGHHAANLHKAKQMRASAMAMNKQASQLEYQIRCQQGGHSYPPLPGSARKVI